MRPRSTSYPSHSATPAGARPFSGQEPLQVLFGRPLALGAAFAQLAHEENFLLVSESRVIDLEGPLWLSVLPLLDGRRTAVDVVRELRSRFSPPEVLEALGALAQNGVLAAPSDVESVAATTIGGGAVVRLDSGDAAHQVLRTALAELGVIAEVRPSAAVLELSLVDNYRALTSAEADDRVLPWMPVKLAGDVAWFGPIFRPGEGACWSCLEQRLRLTREAQSLVGLDRAKSLPGPGVGAAARICALQIARWLQQPSNPDHPLLNHLVTVNVETLQIEMHPVVQRPQCASCGSGRMTDPEPFRAQAGSAEDGSDTGAASDEALLERFAHHVDELTGLVAALEPVAEEPVHVFRARFLRPLAADTPQRAIENRRLVAAGKGTTALAARTGALAEALERYSCSFDGTEPLLIAPLTALGDEAVHPNTSMLFSDRQLNQGNLGTGIKLHVPVPFDADEPVGWLRAWSVTHNAWRYVAAGWALMGYRGPGAAFAIGDSNGNAAGATREDAIVRGVGELIERDAVALWWYNKAWRPGVSLDGVEPEYVRRLTSHYRSIGREFWVLDITSDLGVPTFAAVSRCTGEGPATPVVAFGAHLDARTAVLRAITEMNQMLPHALARAPREDRPVFGGELDNSMALTTLDDHPYLLPDRNRPETRLDTFSTPSSAGLAEQIDWIRGQLEQSGLELIALDLTRPDVGLPVMRVIVPGLRHFWRRLAPGRLYDVPVQLGWCEKATLEDEVNPLELAI